MTGHKRADRFVSGVYTFALISVIAGIYYALLKDAAAMAVIEAFLPVIDPSKFDGAVEGLIQLIPAFILYIVGFVAIWFANAIIDRLQED